MKNFDTIKHKLPHLFDNIESNKTTIDFLDLYQITNINNNNLEKFRIITLDHSPILYDLYNFQGISSTNDPSKAIPSNLYKVNEEGTSWKFILPVFGYRVPYQSNPETLTGASPWQFLATVSIIKTRVNFLNLPDNYIKKTKIINYLYTDNNEPLPSFQITVIPYELTKTSTDYSYFSRWLKVADGYILDFYAFFLYSEDIDVKLKTTVYFLYKDFENAIQSYST